MWGVGAVGVPRPSPALPWGCLPKQPGGQSAEKALHTCQQSNDAGLHCLHIGLASTSNSFFSFLLIFARLLLLFYFYIMMRELEKREMEIYGAISDCSSDPSPLVFLFQFY